MEHAASPSLISLGLTTDTSSEGSFFRWGLISSCVLHAIIIILAMFIKFQSDSEQPFRTIDVALISLPSLPTAAPKTAPAPIKKEAPAVPKKAPPPPKTPTVEENLPPLPTETASERLSESLGGAINSIQVPQKREMNSSSVPVEKPETSSSQDESPLIDKLRLPSAPPTIARPKRLQPAQAPQNSSPHIPVETPAPQKTPAPTKSQSQPPPPQPVEKIQRTVKPAPTLPALSDVTPFTKPKQAQSFPKTQKTPNIEQTLKKNRPTIPAPPLKSTVPKVSRERAQLRPKTKSAVPKISAPLMAKIPKTSKSQTPAPSKPKMSDTVKKLMEGLKSTTQTRVPQKELPAPTQPARSTPAPPSALDQRIAKLSIPEVAPVESIKQRLQVLEVQTTGNPGGSTAKSSPGKNRYLAMVEDRIDNQWVAPPLLASNPIVVLNFQISRTGEISGIRITESSGHTHYDSSAKRAVQAVNPLPPFPSDISDSFFDVTYRFIKD